MAYASVNDVQKRMTRTLSEAERNACAALLTDADVIVDAYNVNASEDAKIVVECRMLMRALGDGSDSVPMGATQGSMSGLGYSQSWTMGGGGSTGELYLSRIDKKLLGKDNAIGSYSPTQELVPEVFI